MNQEALEAKKVAVEEIRKGLDENAGFAIVSYHGLTVAELSELRKKLAEKDARIKVYKNTMVRRALGEEKASSLGDILEGPNAFVFAKDAPAGASVLYKFSRYHEHLVLKGGIVEGQPLDGDGLKAVAKLPTKEALLSMFCMVLNEPMAGFARAVDAIAQPGEAA